MHEGLQMEVFENLLNNQDVDVVGVFDADDSMLEKMEQKAEKEIRLFTDYGHLLDNVEAMVVYDSPTFFLRLRQAMEANVHIMYELPQFKTAEDVRSLLKLLVEDYKRVFAACFPRRYDAIFSGLAAMMPTLEKEYGNLTGIAINTRLFPSVDVAGYDVFIDRLIHDIDALNFLLGKGCLSYEKVLKKRKNYSVSGTFIRDGQGEDISVQLDAFFVKTSGKSGVQVTLEFASGEKAEYRNFGMPKHVNVDKCILFNESFINMIKPLPSGIELANLLIGVLSVAKI